MKRSKAVIKVGAIARYEVLMAWRRCSLPILWLVLVSVSLAFSVLLAGQKRQMGNTVFVDPAINAAAAETGWDATEIALTTQLINHVVLINIVFNIAMILIVAETIPLDRQFKTREPFSALPVSISAYLGGKVVGVWAGVTLILLVGGAVSIVAQCLLLGSFDVRVVALLWLVLGLPLGWANSGISVMAAAFWGSRRLAVMLTLLLLPLFFLLALSVLLNLSYVSGLINPVYLRSVTSLPTQNPLTTEIVLHVSFGLALLAVVTLAVWTVIWALMRLLEAR